MSASADEIHYVFQGIPQSLQKRLQKAFPTVTVADKAARLDETELAAGLRLRDAMQAYGYYDAKWQVHRETSDKKKYILQFSITLGQPVRVRKIDLQKTGAGSNIPVINGLFNNFPLKDGSILDQINYEEWKGKIIAILNKQGYIKADYTRHEILIDKKALWSEIYLWLNTGPRFRFGNITVHGAEHYPQWFIKRYVSFKPGDWYAPAALAVTQSNLRNADRFSDISVQGDIRAEKNNVVPVNIDLKSMPAQHIKVGAGYSTDIGPNAALIYDNYNAFNEAQHVRVSILAAQLNKNASILYKWPVGKNIGSEYIAQASYQNQTLTAYDSNEILASAGRQWTLRNDNSRNKTRTLEALLNVEQANYTVGDEVNNSFYIYPSLQYTTQNFRNVLRPISGYSLIARVEGASKIWGSSSNFLRFSARATWRVRLSNQWVLGTRAKLGAMWLNGPITLLPPNLRFFAGGQNSLPGYAFQSQGPVDSEGAVEGGRLLAVAGVNVQRFVSKNWAVVAFYDAGNAFNSFSDFKLLDDVGLGFRWYSPVGPIRFDLAHPLVNPQAPAVRIAFSVGFSL
ncbi:autotransporter assembly complex family protein [Acidithiobacillus marinus]|uniref:autotransporter assembly complex family protein n=1 Tax=Acidithiobacillus marinus TaxID=187490 RepID=UPI0034A12A55